MTQDEGRLERERVAGRYTWIWMILAVLMVGGFFAWLRVASGPAPVAVVEDAGAGAGAGALLPRITPGDLASDATRFQGQTVRLAAVRVVSPMGTHAFWTRLPDESLYLIKLRPEVIAGGFTFQTGDVISVAGMIEAMTDSVLTAWEQEGAIANESQMAEAQYALGQTFLEAVEAESGTGTGTQE